MKNFVTDSKVSVPFIVHGNGKKDFYFFKMLNKYVSFFFAPFFAIFLTWKGLAFYTHYFCVAIKEVENFIHIIYLFIYLFFT
jgi:hypothetical protein